jgi:type III pantothenate kinase
MPDCLLVDISNTFTKIVRVRHNRLGKVRRLPTATLNAKVLKREIGSLTHVVLASVVPDATERLRAALPKHHLLVGPRTAAGLKIDYPKPSRIGPDRLANAVACIHLHGAPAIVVDFGTAVTFDVISADGAYIGGVIAPGLNVMAEYLHSRTALLPLIRLQRPLRAVGRSTKEAMLSGTVNGYRGLVKEILDRIIAEEFSGKSPVIVATGGDAAILEESLSLFDKTDPLLTLRGLQIIANHHWPD